jgi:hypothetical protein
VHGKYNNVGLIMPDENKDGFSIGSTHESTAEVKKHGAIAPTSDTLALHSA